MVHRRQSQSPIQLEPAGRVPQEYRRVRRRGQQPFHAEALRGRGQRSRFRQHAALQVGVGVPVVDVGGEEGRIGVETHEGGRVVTGERSRRIHAGPEDHGAFERRQPGPGGCRRPAAKLPGRATDEDILRGRVEHPVVALAGVVVVPRHLDEALVQTQIVPDRILPALLVLPVIGEVPHDVLVDPVQREPLFRAVPDRHHDQGVVAVGRFLPGLFLTVLVFFCCSFRAIQRWRRVRHVQIRFGIADFHFGDGAGGVGTVLLFQGFRKYGADGEGRLQGRAGHVRNVNQRFWGFNHIATTNTTGDLQPSRSDFSLD